MAVVNGWRIENHAQPKHGQKDLADRLKSDHFRPVLDLFPPKQFERVPDLTASEGIPIPLDQLPSDTKMIKVVAMSDLYLGIPDQFGGFVGFVVYVR